MSNVVQLNQYINATMRKTAKGAVYYSINKTKSNFSIGAIAMHPEIDEPVLQTAIDTWWNLDCIVDVLKFLEDTYPVDYEDYKLMFNKIKKSNRKTPIYTIELFYFANSSQISWYGAWRQYCLKSSVDYFRFTELSSIKNKLKKLKEEG